MSAKVDIRRIQDITEKEMTQLIALCIRAYKDEPSLPAMVGGRDDLRSLLFCAMIGAGALEGDLYVMENDRQEIVSMALWFGPGRSMWLSEEQRKLGYHDLMKELDDSTKDWWKNTYGGNVSDFVTKSLHIKTSIDCWWLSVLATDADHQGFGYATTLINDMLSKIPGPKIAALCATSKENEGYYNHIGFPTKGYMELPSKFGNIQVYCLAHETK